MFVKLSIMYAILALLGISLLKDPEYKKIEDGDGEGEDEAWTMAGGGYHDGLDDQGGEERERQKRQQQKSNGVATPAAPTGGEDAASPLRRRLYDETEDNEQEVSDEDYRDEGADEDDGAADLERSGGSPTGQDSSGVAHVEDLSPLQLLGLPQAWHVSLCFLLGSLGGLVTLSTYKVFGILTFLDDHFMSMVVGSFSSLSNALGRIFWGVLSDRLGAYRALLILCLTLSLTFFTWILTITPLDSKWAFALWVGIICFCHGGNFAIYPALTADLFGRTNAASNFGVIFLGYGLCSLVGLAVLPRLSTDLSPLNYFLGIIALFSAINVFALAKCYPSHHSRKGKMDGRQGSRTRRSRGQHGERRETGVGGGRRKQQESLSLLSAVAAGSAT